jgi:chromosomal replication initiation ATPase DnaA
MTTPYYHLSPRIVFEAACSLCQANLPDLLGRDRDKSIVVMRRMIVGAMKDLTHASFPEIARLFSKRNHSTAYHAHKSWLLMPDEERAKWLKAVRARAMEMEP